MFSNNEDSGQLDLFLDSNSLNKENALNSVSPNFSINGLVKFRYSSFLKKSIRCKSGFLFGYPEVTLPQFMSGPEFAHAREIASEWAIHAIRRKTEKNKKLTKSLVSRFWEAVDQVLVDKGEIPLESRGRLPPINPKGKYHDLNDVLAAVNETYFNGTLECKITWSNRVGGLSFHSIRKDPFTLKEFHLISISRGYDAFNCPKYAVAGVVYHECLHIAIPVEMHKGRRIVHGRNFKQQEKRYIFFDEWIKWHKEILPKNIRAMRRNKE